MKKKILSVLLALCMLAGPAVTNTAADVPFSVNAEAATYKKLAKPTSVKASAKDGKITLSWKKVSGAEAYSVYKYNASTKKYVKVKTTTKTKLTVSAKNAGTYKFRIYSMDKVDGKYNKGNYAYKKVTVKAASASSGVSLPEISTVTKGMKMGLSLKQVQKAHGFTDYTKLYNQAGSTQILVKNDSGSYNSYAFYADKLQNWGFALKGNTDSNYKKMCDHFKNAGWKTKIEEDWTSTYTKGDKIVLIYRNIEADYIMANICNFS